MVLAGSPPTNSVSSGAARRAGHAAEIYRRQSATEKACYPTGCELTLLQASEGTGADDF